MKKQKLKKCMEYLRNLRKHSRWNIGLWIVIGFFSMLIFFKRKLRT